MTEMRTNNLRLRYRLHLPKNPAKCASRTKAGHAALSGEKGRGWLTVRGAAVSQPGIIRGTT